MITRETRRKSFQEIKKSLPERQAMILDALKDRPQSTARELALYLWKRGKIPSPERNYVHPRLTELVDDGLVRVVGKRICSVTGKMVAIYDLAEQKPAVEQGVLDLDGGFIEWRDGA